MSIAAFPKRLSGGLVAFFVKVTPRTATINLSTTIQTVSNQQLTSLVVPLLFLRAVVSGGAFMQYA